MSYGVYTSIVVEEEQDVFETDRPYIMGSNTLFVYVNGMLQQNEIDFIELDPRRIKFSEPLLPGDRVLMTSSFINRELKIDFAIIGEGKNAIFNRYGSEQRLMFNQEYTMSLKLGDKYHKFTFTSRYSPMYSTVKVIRTDLQEIIEEINNDVINFTLWQNSLLANELAAEQINESNPQFYAKQWVRYRTELDLLNAVYLAITGKSGSTSKRLGVLQIERQYKIPFLKDMMAEIKEKLLPFEKQLTGIRVQVKGFQKSGRSYPYPIEPRRSF